LKSLIRSVALLLLVAGPAMAAQPTAAPPPTIATLAAEVDQADAQTQSIAVGARLHTVDDAGLQSRLAAIPEIQGELDDALSALEPRLQYADARLAELGSPPPPGQPAEDPEIARERQDILKLRRSIDTEVKQAHLISVEVKQLEDYLSTRRQDLFSERLWQHDRSPFDYRFWSQVAAAWPRDGANVAGLLGSKRGTVQTAAPAQLAGWAIALFLAILIAGGGRLFLNRLGMARASRAGAPTRLRRSLLALWFVGVALGTSLLGCLALRAVLDAILPASTPIDALVAILTRAVVFASLFAGLGQALLSPAMPDWRLAPLPDTVVDRARRYPALLGLTVGTATFLVGAAAVLEVSQPTSAVLQCVTNLVQLVALAATLFAVARSAAGDEHRLDAPTRLGKQGSRLPWAIALIGAWLALFAALGCTALGYIALAAFTIREMIWIATVLAMLFLLVSFVDEVFPALASPAGRIGRLVRTSLNLPVTSLEQAGVLLSGFARVALLLFGWTAILAPFGASAEDVFGRLTSSDLVFHLGQVAISPATIIIGFLVFFAGIAVTRGIRGWLEANYLPTTSMDIGAQSALGVGISYLGAIVAIAIASAYLGLSLDKIALFASALSVGIGFGLQSVIGNFVSGLILLAERPVKVGDWIAIGDLEGDIRKISVRATEIEMADRSTLIIPNSDLISKTVRNVTHGNALGRVKIVLRVTDTADPNLVRDLITARLNGHAEILTDPAASVYLTDVRDGALEFSAFAYVASARQAYGARSELLFQIVPDLRAAGIVFANPKPIVNVGVADRSIEPAPSEWEAKPSC
jgi:potassium efflux system protein